MLGTFNVLLRKLLNLWKLEHDSEILDVGEVIEVSLSVQFFYGRRIEKEYVYGKEIIIFPWKEIW